MIGATQGSTAGHAKSVPPLVAEGNIFDDLKGWTNNQSFVRKKVSAVDPSDLPTYRARDLINLDIDLISNLPKQFNVVYDDGFVKPSSCRKLIYSYFFWEFHRKYPMLKLTYDNHIDSVIGDGLLTSSTHIDMFSRILNKLVLEHGRDSSDEIEDMLELVYRITNVMYNKLSVISAGHVATLDLLDILELANDPEVKKLKQKIKPEPGSIEDFYTNSYKILIESGKYKTNNLVQFIRMKILNQNQVNQSILARGYPIEVTGTILSHPILSCYATGLHLLYDYVADSRGASKHLYSAETPLQQSEYFARRLQLVGTVITSIGSKDCGTTSYLNWLVKRPERTTSGRLIYPGDIKFLKGKNYLDETTGKLKCITAADTHLYGKLIKLRSVLYCQELNQHKLCKTCFGNLHLNVSKYANLGHICDANLTQQLSQIILSTKHHIASAVGSMFQLREDARRYVNFDSRTMSFKLKALGDGYEYKLLVNRSEAIGITDLKILNNGKSVSPKRLSSITQLDLFVQSSNGVTIDIPLKIEQNKKPGFFTQQFIDYVLMRDWETTEDDDFIVNMDQWNFADPLVTIPDMEYSYLDHIGRISTLIESKEVKKGSKPGYNTPETLLQELFELTNSKISANIALLEVMVYAVTTPDAENFGLSRGAKEPIVNLARNIIENRSLMPAYAYEGQPETITNPRSFMKQNRPDSPLDVLLAPNQVVDIWNKRKKFVAK